MTTAEDRDLWERDEEANRQQTSPAPSPHGGSSGGSDLLDPESVKETLERLGFGRKRAHLLVSVNLDPVPGWGNVAEDYRALTQRLLDDAVGHYEPVVALADSELSALRCEIERLRAESVESSSLYAQWRDDCAARAESAESALAVARAQVEAVRALADKWSGEWATPRWIDELRAAVSSAAQDTPEPASPDTASEGGKP